jgi:hypothetical protein
MRRAPSLNHIDEHHLSGKPTLSIDYRRMSCRYDSVEHADILVAFTKKTESEVGMYNM